MLFKNTIIAQTMFFVYIWLYLITIHLLSLLFDTACLFLFTFQIFVTSCLSVAVFNVGFSLPQCIILMADILHVITEKYNLELAQNRNKMQHIIIIIMKYTCAFPAMRG